MVKRIIIVEHEKDADYKVFFCDKEYQQRNHHFIAGGKLVVSKAHADVKIIIVEDSFRADIQILRTNFPE